MSVSEKTARNLVRFWTVLLGEAFGLPEFSKCNNHTKWLRLSTLVNNDKALVNLFLEALPNNHKIAMVFKIGNTNSTGYVMVSPEAYKRWLEVPKEFHILYRVKESYTYDANEKLKVKLYLQQYNIIKRTPKGVWIEYASHKGVKKFVNLHARKKFAHETEEDAIIGFKARKYKQRQILNGQLDICEKAINLMEADKIKFEHTFVL